MYRFVRVRAGYAIANVIYRSRCHSKVKLVFKIFFGIFFFLSRASNHQAKQAERQQMEEERAASGYKGYKPPVSFWNLEKPKNFFEKFILKFESLNSFIFKEKFKK